MKTTPRGNRLHIALFGRRNVGKSSLLNALTRQDVAVVSAIAGTTTDPVGKPMELLPIGPVIFIDTAGIDDCGALGELRVRKTRRVLDRADVALVVCAGGHWGEFEEALSGQLQELGTPTIAVFNKRDEGRPAPDLLDRLTTEGYAVVETVATAGQGILELREALIRSVPTDFLDPPTIVGDLVPAGDLAILVVPIDLEAPKGRLILPQVQTIRDLLDNDAYCMMVKERELREALHRLRRPPALVVTDSQAFARVSADTPRSIPLTSFSILFARNKGDLVEFAKGALGIGQLRAGSTVLMCEACTHHPIGEDIGRVQIPRGVRQHVGVELDFVHYQGHDFPDDLSGVDIVIHCGSCMHNRREMLTRILKCRRAGVPITNYGMAIAHALGILERALQPFPAAAALYRRAAGHLG